MTGFGGIKAVRMQTKRIITSILALGMAAVIGLLPAFSCAESKGIKADSQRNSSEYRANAWHEV